MKEIIFLNWKLLVDDEQNKLAYQNVVGITESCDCKWCANFAMARDQTYPKKVINLFEQLGVDCTKEADLYQQGRDAKENTIIYRWWFYFIGKVLEGPQAWEFIPADSPKGDGGPYWWKELVTLRERPFSFLIGFADAAGRRQAFEEQYVPEALKPFELVQIEFNADVSWMLSSPLP